MRSTLRAVRTDLTRIQPLRALFLGQANFQVRYHACHERGWTDAYALAVNGSDVGYGSVKGREIADRDTVFEFFVLPPFAGFASRLFGELLAASGATYIEAQSNDRLMSAMLFEFGRNINADMMLFEAHVQTNYTVPGAVFRRRREGDPVFAHAVEPVGDYVVEREGEIAATGGFLLHYNEPFADVFMEVAEPHRRRGIGTLLVQDVIKQCYLAGRVPAARCHLANAASRATLAKAGMRTCGFLLMGEAGQTTPVGITT
jgi:GNAT superfamily N-acetyltransferase